MTAPLIVIGAGGTAGHVVPALAVADALRADGAEVVFIGGRRAEQQLVPEAGYELHTLRVEPAGPPAARAGRPGGGVDAAALRAARRLIAQAASGRRRSGRAATSPARSGWRR